MSIRARDFYDFVKCPRKVFLHFFEDPEKKMPYSEFLQQKFDEGHEYEAKVVSKLKFKAPEGWKYAIGDDTVLLGHDTIAGAIFVIPHRDFPFETMKDEMKDGITEDEITLNPVGDMEDIDDNTTSGTFEGSAQGTPVKAFSIGAVSPVSESGVYIVALTTPEKYKSELTDRVQDIFNTLQFFEIEINELMEFFAGKYVTLDQQKKYYLYKDGTFADHRESVHYSDAVIEGGEVRPQGADWTRGSLEEGQGKWTIEGTKESGTVTITYCDGSTLAVDYQVWVENGKTYWSEYMFDGERFVKHSLD